MLEKFVYYFKMPYLCTKIQTNGIQIGKYQAKCQLLVQKQLPGLQDCFTFKLIRYEKNRSNYQKDQIRGGQGISPEFGHRLV